jgi:hypothetical protein
LQCFVVFGRFSPPKKKPPHFFIEENKQNNSYDYETGKKQARKQVRKKETSFY